MAIAAYGGRLIMIVLSIILLMFAIVFGVLCHIEWQDEDGNVVHPAWMSIAAKSAIVAGSMCLVIALVGESYRSVPAGTRGVLLRFGAVRGDLTDGAHFVLPYAEDVALVDVQTQKSDCKASAASKDLQTVNTEVAVNYHISPSSAAILYRTVGLDFDDRIIQPAVQETVKSAVAQYTAEDLIRKRAEVKALVDSGLTQRLAAYNIIVEGNGVSLTNFDFSPEFNAAIESKQVAEQSAEKQKYVLQQAQLEAQTAITQAKGEAESNRIKAGALNAQGGSKVLARAWIDKWNGALPTVASGNQQIISLDSLMGGKG